VRNKEKVVPDKKYTHSFSTNSYCKLQRVKN